MNFKLNALVIGAVMTATLSMNANADLVRPTSGDTSEMILSIYTNIGGLETSYTLDTGISLTQFYSAVASGNTSPFTRTVAASYGTWYNALSTESKAAARWFFVGGESDGTQNYITTLTRSASRVTSVLAQTDDKTRSMGGKLGSLYSALNITMPGTSTTANDVAIAATKTTSGYTGNFNGNWQSDLAYSSSAATIGTSMDIYKITASPFNAATSVFAKQVNPTTNLNYIATFDGTTFTIAAVPEADTSAMMIAGIGLIGLIARRRKFNNV